MLHPDIRERARHELDHGARNAGAPSGDAVARVAAQAITREVEASGAAIGVGVAIVFLTMLIIGGVLWLADARDDVREIKRTMERCR